MTTKNPSAEALAKTAEEWACHAAITKANETIVDLERLFQQAMDEATAKERALVDELVAALERLMSFLPNMEPVGAASHAEHNKAAWDARCLLARVRNGREGV